MLVCRRQDSTQVYARDAGWTSKPGCGHTRRPVRRAAVADRDPDSLRTCVSHRYAGVRTPYPTAFRIAAEALDKPMDRLWTHGPWTGNGIKAQCLQRPSPRLPCPRRRRAMPPKSQENPDPTLLAWDADKDHSRDQDKTCGTEKACERAPRSGHGSAPDGSPFRRQRVHGAWAVSGWVIRMAWRDERRGDVAQDMRLSIMVLDLDPDRDQDQSADENSGTQMSLMGPELSLLMRSSGDQCDKAFPLPGRRRGARTGGVNGSCDTAP